MPQLIHTLDSHLDFVHDGVTLFSYVYRPQTPAIESPRPYLHPIRTLGGQIVSGFRPHDHRWHHGLSFTSAHLNGHNFWGGPTFVEGKYEQLENHGRQESDSICPQSWNGDHWFNQDVVWLANEEMILADSRAVLMSVQDDFWQLEMRFQIDNTDNCSGQPLVWGSPTTQGRENAGYGGLFWRGPREFLKGRVLMSDNREGADLMGERSLWLAYIGQHDQSDDFSTLVFVDSPKNPRFPTPWFVRNTEPMVCPNFAFHEEFVQNPGEILNLSYQILIADGAWSRERIESEVEKVRAVSSD